jgi:hypothetical protein
LLISSLTLRCLQAISLSLVGSALSPLQTFFAEQPSPIAQLGVSLRLLISPASGPLCLVLFLLVCNEGEIQSHQQVYTVGHDHLPTLVLLKAGAH